MANKEEYGYVFVYYDFVCVVFFSIFLGIGFNYCLCKGIGGLVWKIISYGM